MQTFRGPVAPSAVAEPEPEAGGLWERLGPGPLRDYVAAGSRVNVSIRRVADAPAA